MSEVSWLVINVELLYLSMCACSTWWVIKGSLLDFSRMNKHEENEHRDRGFVISFFKRVGTTGTSKHMSFCSPHQLGIYHHVNRFEFIKQSCD